MGAQVVAEVPLKALEAAVWEPQESVGPQELQELGVEEELR